MNSEIIQEITAADFETILNEEIPVILDFYSDECAPCESLAPKYEEAAGLFGDKIKFYKIFRQQNRELAKSLGVSSSPTVLFLKNGKETTRRLTGGIKKKELLENIQTLLPPDLFQEGMIKRKKQVKEADVIILGGGPAGMSAAIYAAQAKLKTIMVDSELTGGQVKITHLLSNYPGTGKPVAGYELMHNMLLQAKDSGAEVIAAVDITEVNLSESGGLHTIILDSGDTTILTKSVILSTGAKPRLTGAPGEKEFRGQGISYCATCDGKYYDDKEVIVIGGGNSAVEESLFLTRFAKKLTIIQNLDTLTANKTAIEHALKNPKIEIIYNTTVQRFEKLSDGRMKLTLHNSQTGTTSEPITDGVFIFIGMIPNTEQLPNSLNRDNWGYLLTNDDMETNLLGVYAVGDVRSKKIRQAATAVGDGCIAGVLVEKYIEVFDTKIKKL